MEEKQTDTLPEEVGGETVVEPPENKGPDFKVIFLCFLILSVLVEQTTHIPDDALANVIQLVTRVAAKTNPEMYEQVKKRVNNVSTFFSVSKQQLFDCLTRRDVGPSRSAVVEPKRGALMLAVERIAKDFTREIAREFVGEVTKGVRNQIRQDNSILDEQAQQLFNEMDSGRVVPPAPPTPAEQAQSSQTPAPSAQQGIVASRIASLNMSAPPEQRKIDTLNRLGHG